MDLSLNEDYIKSFPGILKIIEFLFLIVAFLLMILFNGDMPNFVDNFNIESWKVLFFMAAHIASAAIIIPVMILHLLKMTAFTVVFLIEKKLGKSWNAILFVLHLLLAVVCVVSTGFMTKTAKDLDDAGFGGSFPTDWNYLISALVFGFLSFALLFIDAVLCIRKMAD